MRRLALAYVLIPAVLVAVTGLAYYSYRTSRALAERERAAILETTRELAEEKILGIQTELVKADRAVFEAVNIDNLMNLQKVMERLPVSSALVLDARWRVVPGGFFTKRRSEAAQQAFRALFEQRVVPDLQASPPELDQHLHLHANYDGRPVLFAYTRRFLGNRFYYIVVEADLTHLVATVFPQYFAVASPRLYQVVNDDGDVIYGFPFTGVPEREVVELRFPRTVTRWRLRVAQRQPGLFVARDTARLFDLALIGIAVIVIVAGLVVVLIAARRERLANELKSEFVSNVSHELKTPLSIINMFGEMLAMGRTKSPEQATEYASIITRESRRLARLLDNVLDFAKIERGADVYEFADGELTGVVRRTLELYGHRLEREGMTLELDVDDALPAIRMDENAMTLAVSNLIDNAIKYAADGKRVQVSVFAEGQYQVLQVRDFGPGIPDDEQGRVFERFFRATAARSGQTRGSGIGLAIVKHIADAHGGRATVASARPPDRGTTFRVEIPVQ